MPINHPYDPRYNAKVYIPKLTEEERKARATPLENLRGLRFRTVTPAAPVAPASSPHIETVEIATPEVPTVEAPTADVPTPELLTPEPAPQEDLAPDYVPAAWEVVFASFPELYPDHAALPGNQTRTCKLPCEGSISRRPPSASSRSRMPVRPLPAWISPSMAPSSRAESESPCSSSVISIQRFFALACFAVLVTTSWTQRKTACARSASATVRFSGADKWISR